MSCVINVRVILILGAGPANQTVKHVYKIILFSEIEVSQIDKNTIRIMLLF